MNNQTSTNTATRPATVNDPNVVASTVATLEDAAETTDQAIPFGNTYKMLDAKGLKSVNNRIEALSKAETTTRDIINGLVPELIQHVVAGGNIVVINKMLNAMQADRRSQIVIFLQKHLGHAYDKDSGEFGSKIAGKFESCLRKFEEFQQSGQTVMIWCAVNNKVESKVPDFDKRVINAVRTAARKGNKEADHILKLVQDTLSALHEEDVKNAVKAA